MEIFLIVGLGNPGYEYLNTRHNVGFSSIDYIVTKLKISLTNNKFNGVFGSKIIDDRKYIFAKPQTYMNLSGNFVLSIVEYFKININNILVIYDDINFEIGKIKIKPKGSSGGQNGIKDIISKLKSENIKRIKIGIDKPNKNIPLSNFVLSNFNNIENEKLKSVFEKISNIILDFGNISFDKIISKYND